MNGIPWTARLKYWFDERRRAKLRRDHKELFEGTSAILFRLDPMGINFEDNTDEYDAEAGTIIPRLKKCRSEQDVLTVVLQEFRRWFSPEDVRPGPAYDEAAREIWALWVAKRAP